MLETLVRVVSGEWSHGEYGMEETEVKWMDVHREGVVVAGERLAWLSFI